MSISLLQRLFITASVRREWYEVLASMTDGVARMNISTVLKEMQHEFKNTSHPMAPVVQQVITRMTGGRGSVAIESLRLGDSLKGLVPDNEAMMVKAGEERGELSRGLRQASFYVGSSDELVSLLRTSVATFAMYALGIVAMNLFFSFNLLPQMEKSSPRYRWPSFAQSYGWVADHMIIVSIIALLLCVGMWFLGRYLIINWRGKGRDFADQYIWPFTTARLMNASALLMGLSGFVKTGAPFSEAIAHVSHGAAPYMRSKYQLIKRGLKDGKPDYEALLSAKLVPAEREWIIRSYGKTADFGSALEQVSKDFMKYAVRRTAVMSKGLNVAFLIVVAANIGWVGSTVAAIVKSVR